MVCCTSFRPIPRPAHAESTASERTSAKSAQMSVSPTHPTTRPSSSRTAKSRSDSERVHRLPRALQLHARIVQQTHVKRGRIDQTWVLQTQQLPKLHPPRISQ